MMPSKPVYKYDDTVSVDELFSLLDEMKRFRGDRFPAENVFHTSLRNPSSEEAALRNTVSITARTTTGRLIGYLRVLTDHAYMYYILDVMVHPDFRSRGVGGGMVSIAVDHCKSAGFMKLFLTALPGTEKFYKRFGFKESMSPVLTIRGEDHPQPTQK